ncbi:MAG TPA: PQQ-binding-like beta-propeller repeat protein [bacterium]|nr:PQQ-binding-like beta-propeller repeat protein [bacterium]
MNIFRLNICAICLCFLIIFTASSISGEELVLEWARPVKKNLVQLNKREQGGITVSGSDILVATRNGELHQFSEKGELEKTVVFDGEFYFPPAVLDDGNILVAVSNSVFMFSSSLELLWSSSGKTPVASSPFVDRDNIFVQFQDNAIYVLGRADGKIRTSYTYYSEEEVSFLRLSTPFISGDKHVFGFSSGMIVFFLLKEQAAPELIPYYKFKTSGRTSMFEKKEFFDILSMLPVRDTVLFSGGEYGGIIIEGKMQKLENMKNLKLVKDADGTVTGFGEGGVFKFDEEGRFVSKPFSSVNYVSNYLKTVSNTVITTMGEGSIIGYEEGFIHLFSADMKKHLHSVMVPNGISSVMAGSGNSLFVLSDMGVVYKFNIVK